MFYVRFVVRASLASIEWWGLDEFETFEAAISNVRLIESREWVVFNEQFAPLAQSRNAKPDLLNAAYHPRYIEWVQKRAQEIFEARHQANE